MKFGGLRFLEAAHVKDLLAMLRILDNPKDELAWDRVIQMVPGVGPATAVKLIAYLDGEAAKASSDRLEMFIEQDFSVVAEARKPMRELRAALGDCRGSGGVEPNPSEQIERLMEFCVLVFDRAYDDATARLADLGQLAALAAEYGTRSRFLTEITLDPPASTSDLAGPPHLDDDYLILSTIHSAKGGEWDAVFVIHAADGNIPSDMAISDPGGLEEERRLLYVALDEGEGSPACHGAATVLSQTILRESGALLRTPEPVPRSSDGPLRTGHGRSAATRRCDRSTAGRHRSGRRRARRPLAVINRRSEGSALG